MRGEVSCVITGASSAEQIKQNIEASDMPSLTHEQMAKVKAIYERYIRNPAHYLW